MSLALSGGQLVHIHSKFNISLPCGRTSGSAAAVRPYRLKEGRSPHRPGPWAGNGKRVPSPHWRSMGGGGSESAAPATGRPAYSTFIITLPLWLLNSGAYMHWISAMPVG